MKRIVCLLLMLSLTFFPCCRAIKKEKEATDLAGILLTLYKAECSFARVYNVKEPSPLFEDLYGEGYEDVFSSVKEYAAVLSQNDSGFEIHVLKMRHSSEIEDGKELLRARKELLQSAQMRRYLGERYETYLSSAGIYQKDRYLFLLITGENERAIERIKEIL